MKGEGAINHSLGMFYRICSYAFQGFRELRFHMGQYGKGANLALTCATLHLKDFFDR